MAQARRALAPAPRRGRVALLIALPLALLLIGAIVFTQLQGRANPSGVLDPAASASEASSPEESPGPTPSESASAKPSASPKAAEDDSSAVAALAACRAKVRAGDEVLAVAEVGMRHWSDHVQAQTDANADRISTARMTKIFTRTRLAGPDDEEKYEDALAEHEAQEGRCAPTAGMPSEVADHLERCAERERAQEPVLEAADAGMSDWMDHQADMRRSRADHVDHAQRIWLRTWRAAPENIEDYEKAVDRFKAPDC
jgi:hypothetical protein